MTQTHTLSAALSYTRAHLSSLIRNVLSQSLLREVRMWGVQTLVGMDPGINRQVDTETADTQQVPGHSELFPK